MLTKFNLYQPAAIDNSLNSYQIIHKIIHEMNLIIDEVNNIDSKANEYTDEQISLLNSQLRSYINELNEITIAHFEAVERDILTNKGDIADLKTAMNIISGEFDALELEFDNLAISVNERINDAVAALKSYVDLQIEIVKELIDAQNPEVYGVYGRKTTLQNTIDEIKNKLEFQSANLLIGAFYRWIDTGTIIRNSDTIYVRDVTFKNLIDANIPSTVYVTSNSFNYRDIFHNYFSYNVDTPFNSLLTIMIFAICYAFGSTYTSHYDYVEPTILSINTHLGSLYGKPVNVNTTYALYI